MTDLANRTPSEPGTEGAGRVPVTPLGAPPVDTIPGVIERLAAIQSWLEEHAPRRRHDGIACFNFLYHVITQRVLEWIEDGRFTDREYLTQLDVVFANRYFDALRAYDADPDSAPSSWDALFERRDQTGIAPMQFAVAGVNAHVNFDLPLSAVTVCERMGRELGQGTQRADYDMVNAVFAEEMQTLRRHFEDRFERWIDEHVLAHVEDALGNFSVEAARDTAWANAEVLWSLRRHDGAEREFVESLDRLVGLAGRGVLIHL
jgi:hypothetical protein